jgi:AbrB family looped-hinge helix DNA binding protein
MVLADRRQMHTRLTIDRAGRVAIPETFREQLNLKPGDSLEMDCADDRITLRPLRETEPLIKEHGVWVIGVGEPMTAQQTDEMLHLIREERDLNNLRDSR